MPWSDSDDDDGSSSDGSSTDGDKEDNGGSIKKSTRSSKEKSSEGNVTPLSFDWDFKPHYYLYVYRSVYVRYDSVIFDVIACLV